MAATSMMKEYLKKQLKYWVDNFKDDQLPRDFNSKSFSRSQITLNKITLKPDKLAALLHIPHPLIVTRATCSELSIKVPSWNVAEKFVQEPLSLRITDLFIDVKHIDECDDHVRKDSQARARAASLEPDPLGSIASMYQFATIIHERLEISVENITIKLYEKQTLRLRVEMLHFHARTTNAMWQDMRDLTECVDRSPDGLLKTRFKFVSTQCSVYLHHANHQELSSTPAATTGGSVSTDTSIRLLRDHAIAMRMTMFGHRKSKHDAWEVLSSVVDLNLETLPFEMDTRQLQQVYALYCTLATWATAASNKSSDTDTGLLPHQLMRGPLTPKRKQTTITATTESSPQNQSRNQPQDQDPADDHGDSSFALQVTVRFTAHMLLKVQSSRRGVLQLALIAQQAAVNWIQHHDESHEMQVTVHDLSLRHKDKVLFHVKPARDVLQLKRHVVAGTTSSTIGDESSVYFLKWHLQKLECHLENEIAMVVNELYHSMNEIEQAATITCGTCHHKIRLDAIESHVCVSAPATATAAVNGSRRNCLDSTNNNNIGGDNNGSGTAKASWLDSASMPKLRVVLALDELEIVTDSHLFSTVQELMRNSTTSTSTNSEAKSSSLPPVPPPARRFLVKMKDWSLSTESKEFVGDAIFVPVLPLAFQMLECTIRGCGCVYKQQRHQQRKRHNSTATTEDGDGDDDGAATSPVPCAAGVARRRPRWPDRIFAELGHFSLKATHLATKSETFVTADGSSLRLSFSDGAQICAQSAPQMSSYFHIERIRCQLEHHVFQQLRSVLSRLQDPVEGKQGQSITALTLFFAVWEIRNVELTLLHEHHTKTETQARMKAQFRHVGGVADNHQGHLSLQTNFDFRALLQSDAIQFDFPSYKVEGADHDPTLQVETKRARRRRREHAQQERAAQRIQRVFRGFAAARRELLDQQLRHLTRDDQEAHGDDLQSQLDACQNQTKARRVDSRHESETMPQQQQPRRKSSGKSALFGSASDDLAAINPMKMVAAAGVLKDGVMGFVKAKQQQIESEMSDLATQSKESAARFMPKYSAVKNLLSPRLVVATSSSTTTSPTGMNGGTTTTELGMVESVSGKQAEVREVDLDGTETPMAMEGEDEEKEGQEEQEDEENEEEEEEEEEEVIEGEREETGAPAAHSDQEAGGHDDDEVLDNRNGGDNEDRNDGEEPTPPPLDAVIPELIREQSVSATDALLASLPVVVRVMVQVEEHRMCVPINPRETVGVLCREIVRRFNEMFASSGVITHVTLQNPQGGVFAVSDIVGLIYDPIGKPQELFFAYPHDEDAEIKSVVHIQSSPSEPTSPSSPSNTSNGTAGSSTHSSFKGSSSVNKTTKRIQQSGCAFTRCTKLPLPLVVALLANESERELLSHIMKDGGAGRGAATGGGGGGGDEWPELALNASFLDPKREMLQVEVCWRGKSLHVSNPDAFLLCLQQLGLCTSRANSKYVGKIIRDRLKMDMKNPLIHAACMHSAEFQEQFQTEVTTTTEQQQEHHDPKVFYESLQEIVQEDYGVYMRSQD